MDADTSVTEQDLREAIEGDQLVVYYQPKIKLSTGGDRDVAACEALVRWEHPRRGMIYPDAFIPLAEESGLISTLTEFVVGAVVRQIRRWQDDGLSLSVAVNIAPQLLDDPKLPDRYHDLVKKYDLQASQLILEITESGAMADAAHTMEILTRCRLKGFGLSLDDFGTGYSSLVQLHRMPFSEMKIDRSFVMEMDRDEEAKIIVRSIANLGHNIGLSICAEGVETQEALNYLGSLNCETAQGYHMSRPLPAEEILPWCNHWRKEAATA